jgi:hypothetical protein
MKLMFILAALIVTVVSPSRAQDMSGDWQGTLKTGVGELRLVLHITKGADGGLKAILDSPDQGATGIPVSAISIKGNQLDLTVDAVHGTYEGKVSSDRNSITGNWSQGQSLALDFNRVTVPLKTEHKPATPSDIDGTWMGTLDTGAIQLRVVFHIVNTEDGLTATLDSPDQGMKGMPVTSIARTGESLKIEAKQIGGVFEGKVAADRSSIDGKWTQGRGTMPLLLKRVKTESELERKRPQNPTKPYPYREEEVVYENTVQKVRLAATLTVPAGQGPFPAALLITGSGPQDRDESLLGHKPFLVLSDYLTRRGIVVLRADDRGVGKSTGVFANATTADFATDAEAGVDFLKTRSEVNSRKIGLVGHSEGGIIAPMVAARNSDVGFIVMMAGSGVPGDQILVEQVEAIGESSGKSHQEAERDAASEREILTLVETEKDQAKLERELKEKLSGDIPEARIEAEISEITTPWFRYFISYDPAAALRKVTCPVLAINGEKDMQVPPKQNLAAIRAALAAGGNKHFEVDELVGLNHLFQTAKSGAPAEYAQIEETMSPVAMEKVATWILAQ